MDNNIAKHIKNYLSTVQPIVLKIQTLAVKAINYNVENNEFDMGGLKRVRNITVMGS